MNLMLLSLLAATIPLRNPFWPIGYQGEREVISDEPRVTAKAVPETVVEEDAKTSATADALAAVKAQVIEDESQINERLWIAARKSLKIGGTLRTHDGHQAVTINGNIYADGDLMSANVDGRRFTWRVKKSSKGNTLKLHRVRFRELETENETEEKAK